MWLGFFYGDLSIVLTLLCPRGFYGLNAPNSQVQRDSQLEMNRTAKFGLAIGGVQDPPLNLRGDLIALLV